LSRRLKKIGVVVGAALLVLLAWVGYQFVISGGLRTIEPHFAGECQQVSGAVGAEDITFQPGGQMAYVSSDDRRAALGGNPRPGAIYGYHLQGDGPGRLKNLTPKPPPNFHPHGIGLLARPGLPDRLFVVSHPGHPLFGGVEGKGPVHTVEIFELRGAVLHHLRTVAHAALVSPNDVVPVGPQSFYATNDHGTGGIWGQQLEDLLRLARAGVVYHDGETTRAVAGGLRYANGINVSADGERVYVAATTDRQLVTYKRLGDGALERLSALDLETGVDNIERDAGGNLWIGAHPKLFSFLAHVADAGSRAPSQVLKLTPDGQGGFSPQEVFMSHGADLSASAVGAVAGRRLLVGGVFDEKFLDCRMH